jgi:hypothetical protein
LIPGFDNYLWSTGDNHSITTFLPGDQGEGLQIVELIVTQNGCTYIAEKPLTVIICNPGINEYGNAPEIIVYPVPASERIYIEIDEYYEVIDYQIIDMYGKTMDKGYFVSTDGKKYKENLVVSDLTDGMYLLVIKGSDFISIEKFMIRRD